MESPLSVKNKVEQFERIASRQSPETISSFSPPKSAKKRRSNDYSPQKDAFRLEPSDPATDDDSTDYGSIQSKPFLSPYPTRTVITSISQYHDEAVAMDEGNVAFPKMNASSDTFHEQSPLRQRPSPSNLDHGDIEYSQQFERKNSGFIFESPLRNDSPFIGQSPPQLAAQSNIPPPPNVRRVSMDRNSMLPPRPISYNSPAMMMTDSPRHHLPNESETFSDGANKTDYSDMTDSTKLSRQSQGNFSGIYSNTMNMYRSPPSHPSHAFNQAMNGNANGNARPIIAGTNVSPPGSSRKTNEQRFYGSSPPQARGASNPHELIDIDDNISVLTPPEAGMPTHHTITSNSFYYSPSGQMITSPSVVSISMVQDSEDCNTMKRYLQEVVGTTEAYALQYANILIKNGVPNIEVLRRRLNRNPEFLLDIGFDEYMATDIIEVLFPNGLSTTTDCSASLAGRSQYSTMSTTRMPSVYQNGPMRNTTTRRSFGGSESISMSSSFFRGPSPVTTSRGIAVTEDDFAIEVAEIYAKALNCVTDKTYYQQLVTMAEEGNNPFAQGFLMRLLALGLGGAEKNIIQATKYAVKLLPWMKEVIQETETLPNSRHGMYCKYLLGVCYSEGLGLAKDMKEATVWYRLAAEQGYDAAQAYLGFCYYTGNGVVKEMFECIRWYRLAANQGNAGAQCNLGICYELGDGVPKDPIEAVKWYQLAAGQGNRTAQFNLGMCFENGRGIKKDANSAFKYYQLAANQQHSVAEYTLGVMFLNGYEQILYRDGEKAFHWLQRSALQGYAKAQCYLGICYEKGIGTESNLSLAVQYYTLASDQGDASAQYYLGFAYFNGLGISRDQDRATYYYQLAANQGHAAAQNNLGFCFYQGIGVKKNYTQAVYWYQKSAEQGYGPAQYNMGYCYEKGYGVFKKQKEMIKWYKLAAEQGHVKAHAALKRFNA